MTPDEALEQAAISSLAYPGTMPPRYGVRPFRAPHHSASMAALIGGGRCRNPARSRWPITVSCFLTNWPNLTGEPRRLARTAGVRRRPSVPRQIKVSFPARVQLVAAMNPSSGGHADGRDRRAAAAQVLRYLSRLSGPCLTASICRLMFRRCHRACWPANGRMAKTVRPYAGGSAPPGCGSMPVAAGSMRIWRRRPRSRLPSGSGRCPLSGAGAHALALSVRARHRLLKVARTLADLEGCDNIARRHLAEALSYRAMDRLLLTLQRG